MTPKLSIYRKSGYCPHNLWSWNNHWTYTQTHTRKQVPYPLLNMHGAKEKKPTYRFVYVLQNNSLHCRCGTCIDNRKTNFVKWIKTYFMKCYNSLTLLKACDWEAKVTQIIVGTGTHSPLSTQWPFLQKNSKIWRHKLKGDKTGMM